MGAPGPRPLVSDHPARRAPEGVGGGFLRGDGSSRPATNAFGGLGRCGPNPHRGPVQSEVNAAAAGPQPSSVHDPHPRLPGETEAQSRAFLDQGREGGGIRFPEPELGLAPQDRLLTRKLLSPKGSSPRPCGGTAPGHGARLRLRLAPAEPRSRERALRTRLRSCPRSGPASSRAASSRQRSRDHACAGARRRFLGTRARLSRGGR